MNGDGLMDRGPVVSGKKALFVVIGGLLVFMVLSLFATFTIGRVFGNVLDKKAMEHERAVGTQMMRDKETKQKH